MPKISYNDPVLPFLRNVVQNVVPGSPMGRAARRWILMQQEELGIALPNADGLEDQFDYESTNESPSKGSRPQWREIKSAVLKRCRHVKPDDGRQNTLRRVATALGLDDIDIQILNFALLYYGNNLSEQLWDDLSATVGRRNICLNSTIWGCLLNCSSDLVNQRFDETAPLRDSGVLIIDESGDLIASNKLRKCILQPPAADQDLLSLLVGRPAQASLPWQDFDHVGVDRDRVLRILKGAIDNRSHGINILLYGPPGTGKTEFCKTLSAVLGRSIIPVGETDECGGRPSSGERIAALRLAQKMAGRGEPVLLLFDEAEDLLVASDTDFPWRRSRTGGNSRAYFHRLLERTPIPVLWTTNDVSGFGDAVLRRMTYVMEMRIPPVRVRDRLWRHALDQAEISADASEVRQLAGDFVAAPAIMASATKAAQLAKGGVADIRGTLEAAARVMQSVSVTMADTDERFDTSLINADLDLSAIADCLAEAGPNTAFSLCLSGPPGTGKSAFAAHLAQRLDLPLLRKRASDLLSPYVGESEMNIAAAFAEARDERAMLLFDEADSLLASRRMATHGWEISQVNEMLTWMERHPLPFICTTNLADRLDEAAGRRFLFKAKFDFLRPEQSNAAFQRFFGANPPVSLDQLSRLTPADFAIVHRKAKLLIPDFEPMLLVRLLRQENASKPTPETSRAVNARGISSYGT